MMPMSMIQNCATSFVFYTTTFYISIANFVLFQIVPLCIRKIIQLSVTKIAFLIKIFIDYLLGLLFAQIFSKRSQLLFKLCVNETIRFRKFNVYFQVICLKLFTNWARNVHRFQMLLQTSPSCETEIKIMSKNCMSFKSLNWNCVM